MFINLFVKGKKKKQPSTVNTSEQNKQDSSKAILEQNESDEETTEVVQPEDNTADIDKENILKLSDSEKSKKRIHITWNSLIRIACGIGFLIFMALFINEAFIEPHKIKKSIELTRELYKKPTQAPNVPSVTAPPVVIAMPEKQKEVQLTPTRDPNRDEQGRLLQFKELLAVNEDVKGWITITDTNIDYVVMQSSKEDPEYYLFHNIKGEYNKAGTLFLDVRSSVENDSQNYVIYGHNMISTPEKMLHYLLQYKKLSYYKKHPIITFDTIYHTGKWKIFAVFVTNGSDKKEPFFDFVQSSFGSPSEFLNFVYQLRVRSVLNIDSVDVNENDQLLTLSTCSYEIENYRTVIVARKIREGEDETVAVDSARINKNPLYPELWYKIKHQKPPKTSTFEEALAAGEINWYSDEKNSK
jgi:sortase B